MTVRPDNMALTVAAEGMFRPESSSTLAASAGLLSFLSPASEVSSSTRPKRFTLAFLGGASPVSVAAGEFVLSVLVIERFREAVPDQRPPRGRYLPYRHQSGPAKCIASKAEHR